MTRDTKATLSAFYGGRPVKWGYNNGGWPVVIDETTGEQIAGGRGGEIAPQVERVIEAFAALQEELAALTGDDNA